MAGEALIINVGFFRWIFKGCKTNLKDEINGQKNSKSNIRGKKLFNWDCIFYINRLDFQ